MWAMKGRPCYLKYWGDPVTLEMAQYPFTLTSISRCSNTDSSRLASVQCCLGRITCTPYGSLCTAAQILTPNAAGMQSSKREKRRAMSQVACSTVSASPLPTILMNRQKKLPPSFLTLSLPSRNAKAVPSPLMQNSERAYRLRSICSPLAALSIFLMSWMTFLRQKLSERSRLSLIRKSSSPILSILTNYSILTLWSASRIRQQRWQSRNREWNDGESEACLQILREAAKELRRSRSSPLHKSSSSFIVLAVTYRLMATSFSSFKTASPASLSPDSLPAADAISSSSPP